MSKREKCVYCGKVIVTRSKEHIIQNAIDIFYQYCYYTFVIDASFLKTKIPTKGDL